MFETHFCCGGRVFSPQNPLIIAEIGTAHCGSIQKARELIHAAADAGAVCIKFQWVYASEILHPNTGTVPLPGGSINLYERFKELEVPPPFFADVKRECENCGCIFLCSPFGPRSAAELISLQPEAIKIASPELNYVQLLHQCADSAIPLIMSTGVSRLTDITEAVRSTERVQNRILLHCVTSYPAPETDYNVSLISTLRRTFHVPTGISDHSKNSVLVPLTALAYGACAIEKHITLSSTGNGLDDPVALEPEAFYQMTTEIQNAAGIIARAPSDTESCALLTAYLYERFGQTVIRQICGNGKKDLAASEAANYGRTNRSIHAACTIKKGGRFTVENTAILRTEKQLRPGLPPSHYETLLGKTAAHDILSGDGIRAEDIM